MRIRCSTILWLFSWALILVSGAVLLVTRSRALEERTLGIRVNDGVGQNVIRDNIEGAADAIQKYDAWHLTTSDYPWTLFHGMLGRGSRFSITTAGGDPTDCLNWLLGEASWHAVYLGGPIAIRRDWGVTFTHGASLVSRQQYEDHFCQFLYMMSEAGVDPDRTVIRVGADGDTVSLRQMLRDEQNFCNALLDVSWALPVFIRWGEREKWANKFGEEFDISRLVRQHLAREKMCIACFGTHWRMGLAIAVHEGSAKLPEDLRDQAVARVQDVLAEARRSQDPSGQFVLQWGRFPAIPANSGKLPPLPDDESALISHQGHMLEWLMVAISDQELRQEQWPHRGVQRLLLLIRNRRGAINYGGYSHAIHAIRLYQTRLLALWPDSNWSGGN